MKLQLYDLVLFYNSTTRTTTFETIKEIRTVHTSNREKFTICVTNKFKFDATNLKILRKSFTTQDEYVYDDVEVVLRVWRFNENTKNWEIIYDEESRNNKEL